MQITSNILNLQTTDLYINNNIFRYVIPTSYTPTLTAGSCVNLYGTYSILGNMMTVIITADTFAGGTGGATYPPVLGVTPYGYGIPPG
jgi:hypothetical protein